MAGTLKSNLEKIQKTIGDREVLLLAVSKKQPNEKVEELFELGIENFGENYLQEALEKQKVLSHLKINWHFIGQLQSKKIKDIVGNFSLIQTVWRSSEMQKMNATALEKNLKQNFLLQVNVGEEESKQGVLPKDLPNLLEETKLYKNLYLKGLMFFPPLENNLEASEGWFQTAKEIFDANQKKYPQIEILSMGTSSDFEVAIGCGSNLIRLGEVLMGPRS